MPCLIDPAPRAHRHRLGVLLATAAALSALAGCSSQGRALETVAEDVDRTSAPVDATSPSTSPSSSVPATTPIDDAVQDRLVDELRDSEMLPDVSRSDAVCIVTNLREELGDDMASDVIEAAAGERSLELDEARAASDVVLGCIDVRAWMRADAMMSFGASSTEGDCIAAGWTVGELEAVFATGFVLYEDLEIDQLDLLRRMLSETGRCLSEAKVKTLLVNSMLVAPSTTGAQARCYADARIRAVGAAEAVRIEFGGNASLEEANSVIASIDACLDTRAQFSDGLQDEGYSAEDADCVAERLSDEDLRAMMLQLLVAEDLGPEIDRAFDHFDQADEACAAASGT